MLAPSTLLILPPQDAMSRGPIITLKRRRNSVEKANYSGKRPCRAIKIIVPKRKSNLIQQLYYNISSNHQQQAQIGGDDTLLWRGESFLDWTWSSWVDSWETQKLSSGKKRKANTQLIPKGWKPRKKRRIN